MYDAFISFFFFFNDTATTEIYTLSLHDALPIFVTAAGLGAIAWVLWYFLFTRGGGPAVAASLADGVQEVHVTVKGGYTPDTIVVQAGKPLRPPYDWVGGVGAPHPTGKPTAGTP